jgi:uncharacterized protein involved in exopolysaccharide biosynthesis
MDPNIPKNEREWWAAAEIERLRAALQSLTHDPPATLDEPDTDAEVVIKMRAEIERLTEVCKDKTDLLKDAYAQNERLQKDKTQIAEVAARLEAELYAVLTERNVQATEIARLRAALQRIADDGKNCQDYCRNQAARALEPKP